MAVNTYPHPTPYITNSKHDYAISNCYISYVYLTDQKSCDKKSPLAYLQEICQGAIVPL
jgi:hypothetical protein